MAVVQDGDTPTQFGLRVSGLSTHYKPLFAGVAYVLCDTMQIIPGKYLTYLTVETYTVLVTATRLTVVLILTDKNTKTSSNLF